MSNLSIPHCTDQVLHCLNSVKDCLRRDAFLEAIAYVDEALTAVNNEHDWTLRTDQELPIIREYLNNLSYIIYNVQHSNDTDKSKAIEALLTELNSLITTMTQVIVDKAKEEEPDENVDALEIEHKRRVYGS